jgi:phenylacetate-CoA ligase
MKAEQVNAVDLIALFARSFIAPLWARWERSDYLHHYRTLMASQYEPMAVLRQRQLEGVRAVAAHAFTTVPFWNSRFAGAKLDPGKIKEISDLSRLPVLTKADLRAQGELLLAQGMPRETLHEHTTSGSTGVSVTVYRDEPCQQFKRGATLRCDEWTGWRLGERVAAIWGNPNIRTDWKGKLRRALLDRTYVYLDTLKMNEQSMQVFAETLIAKPPSLLFGHAHSLYLFASYLRAKKPGTTIRPKAVLSTCMVLHDFERELVCSVFECPVINRYGCEEVSLIACECRQGEGLHVNAECVFVELLDDPGESLPAWQAWPGGGDRPAQPGYADDPL